MLYRLLLETSDLEAPDFVQYLAKNEIGFVLTKKRDHTPGGGDQIAYTSSNPEALKELYNAYFFCGDDEVDSEMLGKIVEVQQ